MAFTQSTFATVGAQAAPSPTIYSYKTDDSNATLIGAGYFADKSNQLEEGDYIIAFTADGAATYQVSASTGTVTPVTSSAGNDSVLTVVSSGSHPSDQGPVATDTEHQILFGDSVGVNIINITGDLTIATDGSITVNTTGSYQFLLNTNYGRNTASGVSQMHIRVLVDGSQLGGSGDNWFSGQNDRLTKSVTFFLSLNAGEVLTLEVIRDSAGANDGGFFAGNPTPAGWENVPSASIAAYKVVQT